MVAAEKIQQTGAPAAAGMPVEMGGWRLGQQPHPMPRVGLEGSGAESRTAEWVWREDAPLGARNVNYTNPTKGGGIEEPSGVPPQGGGLKQQGREEDCW